MAPDKIGAEELFRRHAADVGRFIRMLGVRGPATDDLVQQVFLVAHRKGGYEVGPAKPITWLRAIAVRVVADHRKSERRSRIAPDDEVLEAASSPDASPEDAAALNEGRSGIQRALASLSFDHRAVFVLFELERESFESIAAILNIPSGTVGSRLTVARAKVLERYRPSTAKAPATASRAPADPGLIREDPAAPAALREDLGEAAQAAREGGIRADRIGQLLCQLGAGEGELGALVDQVLDVARRLDGYETMPPMTQVREIAVHVVLDLERRRHRAGADPPRAARAPRLLAILRALAFRQRAAVVLHEIEGEPCASIGRILDNTAPHTVVTLLEDARKALFSAYRAPSAAAVHHGSSPEGDPGRTTSRGGMS